ncbi:hypothetical protein T439DRAFT_351081 [Meredithblackwellia eburnea MCA 4105]
MPKETALRKRDEEDRDVKEKINMLIDAAKSKHASVEHLDRLQQLILVAQAKHDALACRVARDRLTNPELEWWQRDMKAEQEKADRKIQLKGYSDMYEAATEQRKKQPEGGD